MFAKHFVANGTHENFLKAHQKTKEKTIPPTGKRDERKRRREEPGKGGAQNVGKRGETNLIF